MSRTGWLAATRVPATTRADDFFGTGTGDTCASPVPLCTSSGSGTWSCSELRHAFAHVNAIGSGTHDILLPNSTITSDPVAPGTGWTPGLENINECGDMDLTAPANVTIIGGSTRIGFAIRDAAFPNNGGGGVRSVVQTTLDNMKIRANSVDSQFPLNDNGGGGIYASGPLYVVDSTIIENGCGSSHATRQGRPQRHRAAA